jgi:flagellar M-ring protein FliF
VNKLVTRTKVAPGSVRRLDVALVVDSSVPAGEVAALKTAVASAAGIVPKRGDTLAVSRVRFAKDPAPAATAGVASMADTAKYGAIGVATLAFLFFAVRQLRRREREPLAGEPVWLRQVETHVPLAELDMPPVEPVAPMPAPNGARTRRQVEQIVEQDPSRIAQQLRMWMAEEPT